MWPEEHCVKAPELMQEGPGCGDDLIHAVCSHGYGLCCDVEPEHEMEKVLFAADELTGLIGAAAKMRPSKSVMDMEVKQPEKEVQGQEVRRGLLARRDPHRCRASRLDARGADGKDDPRHALLRGERQRSHGKPVRKRPGNTISCAKKMSQRVEPL